MNSAPLGPIADMFRNVLIILDGDSPNRITREYRWILHDFGVNSAELTPDHRARIDLLLEQIFLQQPDATWVVDIVGRASQTDTDAHNLALGYNRAQTVRSYLLAGGISEYRLPPARSEGSRVPYIDAPNVEEPLNRSVEIVWRWNQMMTRPTSDYDPGATVRWTLNLGRLTLNAGLVLGGMYIQGELIKRHPDGDEMKPISILLLGLDLSGPFPASGGSSSGGVGGEFELPSAVNWDWFDGQYVYFAGVEASMGGSASAALVRIGWGAGANIPMASSGAGSPTIGGFTGAGYMNVIED